MAKILATLIRGQHYHVNGITFINGKEVEIEESLKDYLEDNSHFELNVVEEESVENEGNVNLNEEDEACIEVLEKDNNVNSEQEETSKQKGMVLKGRGAKNKQEGDK